MSGKKLLDADQASRFAETARALGADESEDAFRAKLAVIARQKPKAEPEPPENRNAAPGKGRRSG